MRPVSPILRRRSEMSSIADVWRHGRGMSQMSHECPISIARSVSVYGIGRDICPITVSFLSAQHVVAIALFAALPGASHGHAAELSRHERAVVRYGVRPRQIAVQVVAPRERYIHRLEQRGQLAPGLAEELFVASLRWRQDGRCHGLRPLVGGVLLVSIARGCWWWPVSTIDTLKTSRNTICCYSILTDAANPASQDCFPEPTMRTCAKGGGQRKLA